ncbi:class I SAM-dependent methyltransferase [Portibacter lacus]|nr:class I SAM-dependent methyltransferase [Portibacter lacus]
MKINFYEKSLTFFKLFLPDNIYRKLKSTIRSLTYGIYKGNNVWCNICGTSFKKFFLAANGNEICPRCGSIGRARSIWMYLNSIGLDNYKTILHFSPDSSLMKKFKNVYSGHYLSTDYSSEFEAEANLDITDTQLPDNSFQVAICLHVLEHIMDDHLAFLELYRILTPDGICLIQTPYKEGEIYEDKNLVTESERLIHFGQKDHVRVYSYNGLKERLEEVGFKIEKLTFSELDIKKYKLSNSPIIIARK